MVRPRWLFALGVLLTLAGCRGTPVGTSTVDRADEAGCWTPARHRGEQADFATRLRGEGFAVERIAEASLPFPRTFGALLHLSGGALAEPARLQVYTDDPTLAAADAERVQPDTTIRWTEPDGSVRMISYMWVAPPHFFRRERVLVLYAGTDPAVLALLTSLLGPQFAGR